jgi:histidinol-phosphate aminotransferase
MRSPASFIRPLVHALHPYVPGEQPRVPGLIKLNTNENPYPPAPQVLAAIRQATDARLRLYPNPTAHALRGKLARLHGCAPEQVFVGNGSDEILALAVRAFVEPQARGQEARLDPRTVVQYFTPSYSLYGVLADTHGARSHAVPLAADFGLPSVGELRRERAWRFDAALTLVTTPNAPSGRGYATSDLDALCRAQHGVVLLDEAYVDFARQHALRLALTHRHVLVARTFSKAYSLCFQRVGYAIGDRALIEALDKIRDSYNVNGLGQVAALATLRHRGHYRGTFRRIIRTRARLTRELTRLGFDVLPSETNFVLVRPPRLSARLWLDQLRARRILVRWFDLPIVREFLRITIGTDREVDALVSAAAGILAAGGGGSAKGRRRKGAKSGETKAK